MQFHCRKSNRVLLPPGYYQNVAPIRDPGIVITSADPARPAAIEQLTVYAAAVGVQNIHFPALTNAAVLRGDNCFIQYCQFINNDTAIQSEKQAWITHNVISGFMRDGIQFCGDQTIIERNVIGELNPAAYVGKQPHEIAHHDCIQGWAGDPRSPFRSAERYAAKHSLDGVTIRNNTLYDRPGSPLQGVTFFDGLGFGWQVANNNLMLYGPHPFTLLGQRSLCIENNYLAHGEILLPPARRLMADGKTWAKVPV